MPDFPIKIYRVKSRDSSNVYYLPVPSADTDMVTDGMILLTSKRRLEIQILSADTAEYQLGPYHGSVCRAERENRSQDRADLFGVGLDLEQVSNDPGVCPFAFHDIYSEGLADAIEIVELEAYFNDGGRIIDSRSEPAVGQ